MLYYILFGILETYLNKWMMESKMQANKKKKEMEHLKTKKKLKLKTHLEA